jgi:RNA polymerase sigma factor (sigma-70 family)
MQQMHARHRAAEAIQQLMETDGSRMYGLALKLCRNQAEAEDLVQDTFLQAYRKWGQFEGRSEPTSWLYTIASRLCQRRQRRRSGEPRHVESLTELLPVGETTIAEIPAEGETPLDEHLRKEKTSPSCRSPRSPRSWVSRRPRSRRGCIVPGSHCARRWPKPCRVDRRHPRIMSRASVWTY